MKKRASPTNRRRDRKLASLGSAQRGQRRLVFFVVILLALVVSSILIARAERLQIHQITVLGVKTIDSRAIEEVVERELIGNHLWLYPKRHAWWYSPERILAAVGARFPQLAQIELAPVTGQELRIRVRERSGRYLWCAERSGEGCLFIDELGVVFATAPRYSGHLFFEFGSFGAVSPTLGETLLPPVDFQVVLEFRALLAETLAASGALGASRIYRVELLANRDLLFLADWPASPERLSFELRFNLDQEAAVTARHLRSVLAAPDFLEGLEDAEGRLEYLDLRFLPKVFYRFASQPDASSAIMSQV